MTPTAVTIFMLSMVVVFIGVDIVLFMDKRDGNTYSEIIRRAGHKWMPLVIMLSFGFGLLAGHWWW